MTGVDEISATGWGQARFDGADSSYSAIDPDNAGELMSLDLSHGSLGDLGPDGVMVSKATAKSNGWKSATRSRPTSLPPAPMTCGSPGSTPEGLDRGTTTSSASRRRTRSPARSCRLALVSIDAGADREAVQDAIAAALADHPDAKVLDQEGFEAEASGVIDKLLTFVTVMLLLAVLIALLGIVNTLALSVFERTRELGLLRAVGMTRAQVRAMVRWESVVISLIGALTGAADRDRDRAGAVPRPEGRGHHRRSPSPFRRSSCTSSLAAVAGVLAAARPGEVGRQGRRPEGGGDRLRRFAAGGREGTTDPRPAADVAHAAGPRAARSCANLWRCHRR